MKEQAERTPGHFSVVINRESSLEAFIGMLAEGGAGA